MGKKISLMFNAYIYDRIHISVLKNLVLRVCLLYKRKARGKTEQHSGPPNVVLPQRHLRTVRNVGSKASPGPPESGPRA